MPVSNADGPAPSGVAAWVTMRVPAASPWPPASLVTLPDGGGSPACFALMASPILDRGASGAPVLSLTVLLERQPQPLETDIGPLIVSGTCSLQVVLSVPAPVRAGASRIAGADVLPLYARDAKIRLVTRRAGKEQVLASIAPTGTLLKGALAATLTRDEVLEVIGALDGGPSSLLRVDADVTFRAAAPDAAVTITGYWAAVHDFLAAAATPATHLNLDAIERAFEQMVAQRVIEVWSGSGQRARSSGLAVPAGAFRLFLRSASPVLRPAADGEYDLCRRPHPSFRFELTEQASAGVTRTAESTADIRMLLNGALAGFSRDAFVKLVAPGGRAALDDTPRRMRQSSTRAASQTARAPMALAGQSISAIAQEMRPSTVSSHASALAGSDAATLHASTTAGMQNWIVTDLLLHPDITAIESLPIVADPAAAVWRDRVRSDVLWYAPRFDLSLPDPAGDPASSPFAFTFRRQGATADGRPALSGAVRLRLRKTMSDATRKAVAAAGGARAVQIPLANLSAGLSIPYVNESDGRLRRARYQGQIVEEGNDLALVFDLLNDSVRLAYGALSTQGFQAEPARVHVAYSWRAWVPIQGNQFEVQLGGKISVTTLTQRGAGDSRSREVAFSLTPGGPELKLVPEASDASRALAAILAPRPALSTVLTASTVTTPALSATAVGHGAATAVGIMPTAATSVSLSTAVTAVPVGVQPAVVVARPPLTGSQAVTELIRKIEYGKQTLVREETLDAFVSCERFGSLYREETNTGPIPIGCADALRLGQATVNLYREMSELADARYRVFRSLVQPGRFLVLPAAYRITRYSPAMGEKAYRPAVAVYSSLDLTHPENNRVIYHATLQPDIPVHLIRRLEKRLAAEARDPVVEYPTEIASETEYTWSVAATVRVEPLAVKMWDGFQVTLATDLAGALVLKTMVQNTGVFGAARFRLQDGSTLDTVLAFDLGSIMGPWKVGPLSATITGTDVLLRNMIETPVNTVEAIVESADRTLTSIPIDATLRPGETRTVRAGGPAVSAWADCAPAPAGPAELEEIRSFVEDIHTNVVFINLMNFSNHGLTAVDLEARLKGVPGTRPVPMSGDPPRGVLDFLLPITTYLAQHILQFRVLKTFSSAAPQTTPWLDWDLETKGNVVSLTWELIA